MIETQRLLLIDCNNDLLEAIVAGNETLAKKLNINIEENWSEFGVEIFHYTLTKLSESQEENGWWTYLIIYKQENKLIGNGGYKGKPTLEGEVEIGYEIAKNYRNQGLATEMARELLENAFEDKRVKSILAHTLAEQNPSTRVLKKCRFKKVEEINDPDEGMIWKWELKKKNLNE